MLLIQAYLIALIIYLNKLIFEKNTNKKGCKGDDISIVFLTNILSNNIHTTYVASCVRTRPGKPKCPFILPNRLLSVPVLKGNGETWDFYVLGC